MNASDAAGERVVVLLFGPPGAGKTTLARQSGLTIYDRDDPEWGQNETRFRAALVELGHTTNARAVVIRAGTTAAARAQHKTMVQATHTYMVWVDRDVAHTRVKQRARSSRDHINVVNWYDHYQPGGDVTMWPGDWPTALSITTTERAITRAW